MNTLESLTEKFERFPGIGARQARRFAFHILTLPSAEVTELARLIVDLKETVIECRSCRRFYAKNGSTSEFCNICSDSSRDHSKLLVVERDADIQPIERSGAYDGLYFVLGGTVPLLESKENSKLRGGGFKALVETRLADNGLKEVILGFSLNPDGENTARFVESILAEIPTAKDLRVTHLGRGLSTGSELEYADPDTLKNALRNRF